MVYFRVIPILLIDNEECYKIIQFKKKIYIGDPINIIKIFNDIGVDEIIILDISKNQEINLNFLNKISGESFVPLTYGGKIKNLFDVENVLSLGFEKISLNSLLFDNLSMVDKIIKEFGSSTINISVNIKKNLFGQYKIYDYRNKNNTHHDFKKFLKKIQDLYPGEILITFVNNDGMKNGFDLQFLQKLRSIINCNMLVYGGLSSENEILKIKEIGMEGVCGSSIFCFSDKQDSVLINYLSEKIKSKIYGI